MKINNQIFNFAKKIIGYPRSLSGNGVRKTLNNIREVVPQMKIKYFNTIV